MPARQSLAVGEAGRFNAVKKVLTDGSYDLVSYDLARVGRIGLDVGCGQVGQRFPDDFRRCRVRAGAGSAYRLLV